MARNPKKQTTPTKKHLARIERERLQTRWILIVSAIVLILVLGVIAYGILEQSVLREIRPVAIVNGEKILTRDFRAHAKYARYSLIQNASNTFQIAQIFGNDPNSVGSFVTQLQQIEQQLDPQSVGNNTLNQMVDDRLIRQEAEKMGITVSPEEIEKELQAGMQFFPEGTYTPTPTFETIPTSTLSPLQLTLIPPTPTSTLTPTLTSTAVPTTTAEIAQATSIPTEISTATLTPVATEVLTPTATPTITPSPTPYTLEAYQKNYQDVIKNFQENYEISETTIRELVEDSIYRQKMLETVVGKLPPTEEQVWAMHILVEDETIAKDILSRLEQGEDWSQLAATFSRDTSNNLNGGDLGWFGRGKMVAEFEEAAFNLPVGETSEPVQTQFGWHIIRVLGHEDRPISGDEYQQMRDRKFQEWLTGIRENSEIEIKDYWTLMVPLLPTMPPEITQFLQQYQSQQSQPANPFQP